MTPEQIAEDIMRRQYSTPKALILVIATAIQAERDRSGRDFGKPHVDKLRSLLHEPHEHHEGQNECHICDESLLSVACRTIEQLQAEREEARRVIEPFVRDFQEGEERYKEVKSTWYNEMPGDWPKEIHVTMADCRVAAAYMERFEPKEKANG